MNKENKELERKVIELRREGYSRNEISKKLHIGHNKVQFILDKYKLSAKHGIDYRKTEVVKKRKSKIKNKKVLKKIEKSKKKYKKKFKKKKIKKIEKPKKKIEKKKVITKKYIYAYIRYQGYYGVLLKKGEEGTKWYQFYFKEEINDTINLARAEAHRKLYYLTQSLKHVKYVISYILAVKENDKIIKREKILEERGEMK